MLYIYKEYRTKFLEPWAKYNIPHPFQFLYTSHGKHPEELDLKVIRLVCCNIVWSWRKLCIPSAKVSQCIAWLKCITSAQLGQTWYIHTFAYFLSFKRISCQPSGEVSVSVMIREGENCCCLVLINIPENFAY